MTEKGYRQDIIKKCRALGTWRDEFARTCARLAAIYARLDAVEDVYVSSGGDPVVKYTNAKGGENLVRNPYLVELDGLYMQALTYEKELGLTAASLKKINESALSQEHKKSALEAALESLDDD